MSLEDTLIQTNSLLQAILTAIQTAGAAGVTFGTAGDAAEPEKAKRTRSSKADAKPAGPDATYWLIAKHNTVYAQEPGMTPPSIEGAVQVTKEEYEAKKLQFSQILKGPGLNPDPKPAAATPAAAATSAPTAEAAVAAAPATMPPTTLSSATTPSAPAASAAPTAPADLYTSMLVPAFTKLNTSTAAGHGREAILKLLAKHLPGVASPRVAMLAPMVDKHAAILADVNALLNPPAPAADDLF